MFSRFFHIPPNQVGKIFLSINNIELKLMVRELLYVVDPQISLPFMEAHSASAYCEMRLVRLNSVCRI